MDEIKPWYTSKTVWASFVGALSTFLALFGINIGDLSAGLTDQILGVVTLISTVVAIYSRIVATKQLVSGATPGPTLRNLMMVVLLPAIALGALTGGALSLTSCATVQPGADPVVVNAERTTALAVDTFDTFLQFEYTNRAGVAAVAPAAHDYAEVIRRNGQAWLQNARALTRAYKLNRTPENKASLQTAIAVLQSAITISQQYLSKGA